MKLKLIIALLYFNWDFHNKKNLWNRFVHAKNDNDQLQNKKIFGFAK
jgi:hypothetical protein